MLIAECGMRSAGFTLIELALVTAVLAALLVASIPRFQSTTERLRVEQRAFEFAQLLRYARERAVAQGRDVHWVWDDGERRVHLEAVGDDGTFTSLGEQTARSAPLALPAAVRVMDQEDEPVSCACVRFFPDGTAVPTTIVLSRDGQQYTVRVDGTTGQATLSAGTAAR